MVGSLVFAAPGDDDVGMHHGWIYKVFDGRFHKLLVLLQNAFDVATAFQNVPL